MLEDYRNFFVEKARAHLILGVVKGLAFGTLGIGIARNIELSLWKIMLAEFAAVFIGVTTEFIWYHFPEHEKHKVLLSEFGQNYTDVLDDAICSMGAFGIANSHWISKAKKNLEHQSNPE